MSAGGGAAILRRTRRLRVAPAAWAGGGRKVPRDYIGQAAGLAVLAGARLAIADSSVLRAQSIPGDVARDAGAQRSAWRCAAIWHVVGQGETFSFVRVSVVAGFHSCRSFACSRDTTNTLAHTIHCIMQYLAVF